MSTCTSRCVLAVLSALALFLTACGGGNHATQTPPATGARAESPTTDASPAKASRPAASPGAPTTTSHIVASPTAQSVRATTTTSSGGNSTPVPTVTSPGTGRKTPPSQGNPIPTTVATATPSPTAAATATAISTATATLIASATSTDTPTSETVALTITEQGFGQADGAKEAGYGFVVRNPRADVALENSDYTITAYSAGGAELTTEHGTIDVVLPGATLGIGGSLFPTDGVAVASIQVTVAAGVTAALPTSPPSFTTDKLTYFGTETYPFVTGVIGNPISAPLQDLIVYALLRDKNGAIVGGGNSTLDFAPPNGQAGVSAFVSGATNPASVELYPALSAQSLAATTGVMPDGAQDLAVATSGWGATADHGEAGYGFVVNNPNAEWAIRGARYQVVVYDAAGVVLERAADTIPLLLPGATLGLAGTLYLPADHTPTRIETQLLTGAYVDPTSLTAPLITADAAYVPGDAPSVTGTISNVSVTDQTNVMVYVLAYDANGQIIGGGSTVLVAIVADGQETVDIQLVANAVPAALELYALAVAVGE